VQCAGLVVLCLFSMRLAFSWIDDVEQKTLWGVFCKLVTYRSQAVIVRIASKQAVYSR
jgi:hypothetical protein